jgi:hypothetical protein
LQFSNSEIDLEQTVVRGLVWALVGVIFALVFVAVSEALRGLLDVTLHVLLGAVGAAALTALLYGSMRLTVMTANFTFIAMLVYTWASGGQLAPEPLIFVGASVGLVVGTLYGWHDKQSRIFCADAKIMAGVLAGLLAGGVATGVALLLDGLSHPWLAMVVAPIGTLIYVSVAHWFVRRCHHWLPAVANGAIVGCGVGAVTGLFFMVMAGTLDPELLGSQRLQVYVDGVGRYWIGAMLGCAAVNFAVGVVRAIMRVPWYNL